MMKTLVTKKIDSQNLALLLLQRIFIQKTKSDFFLCSQPRKITLRWILESKSLQEMELQESLYP